MRGYGNYKNNMMKLSLQLIARVKSGLSRTQRRGLMWVPRPGSHFRPKPATEFDVKQSQAARCQSAYPRYVLMRASTCAHTIPALRVWGRSGGMVLARASRTTVR